MEQRGYAPPKLQRRGVIIMKKILFMFAALGVFVAVQSVDRTHAVRPVTPTLVVDDDSVECPNADYATIEDAVNASSGESIMVCDGEYDGVELTKQVTLRANGDARITGGPAHSSGYIQGFRMLAGSDGSMIRGFTFEVDFPVMNGAEVDNVNFSHNTLLNPLQGVSNWVGDNWDISYNTITDLRSACGGGIAILVGNYTGASSANGNRISNNTISGTLHVSPTDCGGYDGTGIVLFADHRFGRSGGPVEGNMIHNNTVSLVSDTPSVVDVVGVELTDTRDDLTVRDVVDNQVRANDLSGTANQTALTPENLDEFNRIDLSGTRHYGRATSSMMP